jgi:hypothetical protein
MELARLLVFALGVYLSGMVFSWAAARIYARWRRGVVTGPVQACEQDAPQPRPEPLARATEDTGHPTPDPAWDSLEQDLEQRRRELGEAREALDQVFGVADPSIGIAPSGDQPVATSRGDDPLAAAFESAQAAHFLASQEPRPTETPPEPSTQGDAGALAPVASARRRQLEAEAAELAPLRARLVLLSKRLEALAPGEGTTAFAGGVPAALAKGLLETAAHCEGARSEQRLAELARALTAARLEVEQWQRRAAEAVRAAGAGYDALDRELERTARHNRLLKSEADEARAALDEAQELLGRALELVHPARDVGAGL